MKPITYIDSEQRGIKADIIKGKEEDNMDYRKTAQEIYDHIGKKENIIST